MTGGTIDLERRCTAADLDDLPEDGRCWLLDVDVPSLRVLELVGGDYVEVAYARVSRG